MWEQYLLSRGIQYVTFRAPHKLRPGAEKIVTFLFPTGIVNWPNGGALMDQPYLTVKLFSAFLAGEQHGAILSAK
jgi:hypothetical protein